MGQEKCLAYFFAQMKRREEKGTIMELESDGKVVTGWDNLLKVVEEYYRSLFGEEKADGDAQEKMLGFLEERLSEDERKIMERSITNHELYEATKTMKNNKVPGIDGLTKEFYITFWDLIGDHLLEVFNEMCEKGRRPKSMRTGVISLIHKKGSPAALSNYRPLSMVCMDYKILSRTLAIHLARAMPAIINADQTCGVKGRQIGWNLQLHRDVLMYIEERNLTSICVTLDQQKAFDRVNHNFLWRVMRTFDIGKKNLNWISMMYTDIICKVKVNGYLTEEVQQKRGLQQGCPLSTLLCVIYVEPLACAIRRNEKIRGVVSPGGGGVENLPVCR